MRVTDAGRENLGQMELYGNAGYRVENALGQQDYWYAGAVVQRELSERLSLGVELFGNTSIEPGSKPDIAFNVGGD
ncbi:MAG TPA: hypothetical protein VF020_11955 [Chthoniobacterales bacterium]